jgi:hypothetical protein
MRGKGASVDIGLAYDRVDESSFSTSYFHPGSDAEETATAIASNLERQGHRVTRIGNSKDLVTKLNAGERWDMVFNACREGTGTPRVTQVPTILDIYDIPYTFSDALTVAITQNEATTSAVAEQANLPTCNVNCTGRRLLVGIVGTGKRARVVGVMEDSMRRAYTHSTERLNAVALDAWRKFECKDAGIIVLRMASDGTPHFVQAQPMANLHPTYSDFAQICRLHGMSYCDLMRGIMNEAVARLELSELRKPAFDQIPWHGNQPNASLFAHL